MPALLAQATDSGSSPFGGQFGMLPLIVIFFGIFYFMIIRPQQKKQKETDAMLQSISKGDRVLTTGGVFGTVVGKKTDEVIVLKVADDVKMEFSKQSIVRVLERGE